MFSVSHSLYWLLCCVYNSKVTIIITLEVACYFVSICSDIERTYNWNYSLKCRGLIKRTFLDLYRLYSSKLRIHRTKSPPMEGPHTNVGTWAPSYLATLLSDRGSAGNYCFLVEFSENKFVNFYIKLLLNNYVLLKSLLFLFIIKSSEADYYIMLSV